MGLLQRNVRLHGVRVGRVVDVIFGESDAVPVGLEVRCEDGEHRFLPMPAASPVGEDLIIDSPFALLDTDQLEFYRQRGTTLRSRREPAA